MNTYHSPVLVTGVAGYIGAQVARALRDAGWRVVGIDNLSTGSRGNVPLDIEFVEEDFGNEKAMIDLMRSRGTTEVIHLGAFVEVEESMHDPRKYLRNNTYKTRKLIRAAIAAGVERFVFSSTAAVYGDPSELPISEETPTKPVNYYGWSKLKAEKILQAAASKSGLEYAILRYFNVAGTDPDERGGYSLEKPPTHLIRTTVQVALGRKECLEIRGADYSTPDGTGVRDYIHIADLAEAHLTVLRHLENGGASDIFNIGTGRGHSVLEVKEMVEKVSGQLVISTVTKRREGDPAMLWTRADKIRGLGWRPRYELHHMVEHELKWVHSRRKK